MTILNIVVETLPVSYTTEGESPVRKKGLPVTSTTKAHKDIVPQGIEFIAPPRTRADALECKITNTEKHGKRYSRLTIARWVLHEAGFKAGQKLILLRGKRPHHRWIRLEEADYGQRVSDKGNLALSVKQVLKPDLRIKSETVTPLVDKGSIYFELPEQWVIGGS